ncbi:MAG TPA: response regulator [Flavitalea sp.]|nr:response regulator [Flavitalea sp.]
MNINSIYIVDDDAEDDDLVKEAFNELGIKNEVRFFRTGEEVLNKLRKDAEVPFLIISDVRLSKIDEFELREKILNETSLKDKTVPFIFWSTSVSEAQIIRAYNLSAHGFFLKGRTFQELKQKLSEMVSYWSDSLAPKS